MKQIPVLFLLVVLTGSCCGSVFYNFRDHGLKPHSIVPETNAKIAFLKTNGNLLRLPIPKPIYMEDDKFVVGNDGTVVEDKKFYMEKNGVEVDEDDMVVEKDGKVAREDNLMVSKDGVLIKQDVIRRSTESKTWKEGDVMIEGRPMQMDLEKEEEWKKVQEGKQFIHAWLASYCKLHPKCDLNALIRELAAEAVTSV